MLIARILLGEAIAVAAIGAGWAADLPTRKAAPAAFVKICNVDGNAGFVIPGSGACLKIGGLVIAHVEAGNTKRGYAWSSPAAQGVALVSTAANLKYSFGWSTRGEVDFDARQDTAYGVLRGYAALQFNNGNGFDTDGDNAYIDLAYIQWAGATAGKAPSFFSFFAGGEGWINFFSPNQQESNEPDLLAYTATFGGGYSATIAVQSPGATANGSGTNLNVANYASGDSNAANFGARAPDVVANVRMDEDWGAAQLAGVAHPVHVFDAAGNSLDAWGFAVLGGLTVNLPTLGEGDKVSLDAVYSRRAIWYSGIPDGMAGENGAVNGNGLAMSIGDAYSAGGGRWAIPTAWSAAVFYEHHFSPTLSIDPEIAYAQLHWSGSMGQLSSDSRSLIVGAVAHWDPVPQLDFALEAMCQATHQSTPGLYGAAAGAIDGRPSPFPSSADGVAGRFYVTRSF